MTNGEFDALRAVIREELAPINGRLDAIDGRLDALANALVAVQADLAAMRPKVDGIPLIQRTVSIIQQEQRMMKAAINDLARTQFTSGEVEALHEDVNSVQSTHLELETRIVTLEREVKEAKAALEALKQR